MQVRILKDFKWSHAGRLVSYQDGQVIEVDSKNGESMIKHAYAELFVEKAGVKAQPRQAMENKMIKVEVENKDDSAAVRKSKKIKG